MNEDPASLDRLHDLVIPPPVPWWPPTPGWWVVLGCIAVALILVAVRAFIRSQADRYRREALALIDDSSTSASEWPAILKRCALAAWPRAEVGRLTGAAWDRFFRESVPEGTPPPGTGSRIEELAFTTHSAPEELGQATRGWIRHHRREERP